MILETLPELDLRVRKKRRDCRFRTCEAVSSRATEIGEERDLCEAKW